MKTSQESKRPLGDSIDFLRSEEMRGRPSKTGYINKKVGVSLPEWSVQKSKEEELDLSLFFTKILEVRYSSRREELLALLEEESRTTNKDLYERETFTRYVFPVWTEYKHYLIPYQISGGGGARSYNPARPPYSKSDGGPDLFISKSSGGNAIVKRSYINKKWTDIIRWKEEFNAKLPDIS